MSYQSEVLADSPVLYYRVDTIGSASNGDPVPDTSTSNLDGVLNVSGSSSINPWGWPSPIETDPLSRAFFCHNDPGVSLATITRASNGTISPSGDFTLEAWIKPEVLAIDFVGKRNALGDSYCFRLSIDTGGRFTGRMRDSANTEFTVTAPDEGGGQNERIGSWWHVVLVRLGNALSIYVNASLKATTTITSGLGTLAEAGEFRVHGGVSGDFEFYADEVALYATGLGGTRITVHYEAALLTLHSSATIIVRVPVTLDTDSIEPIDFPFTHNWTDPISGAPRTIVEYLSWKTHSNRSQPDYHQRVNARPHGPQRVLEYAVTPTSARARATLQRALWQPATFYRLPIATDWVELTAPANATDVVLTCDTTLRDFEIGSYVTVWRDVYDPTSAQTFRITSRTNTQLGISPAVTITFPIGSQLMPARIACLPDEESTFDSYAIDSETGALRFEIIATELSSRRVAAYTPTSTHESIEVFSLDNARFDVLEQAQYQIRRRQLGTGLLTGNDYYRAVDTIAALTIPVRVLLVSRETLAEFYGWLEARQGRQNPVWVPSRDNDLELVAKLSATTIKTIGYADYNLHYGRRHIQLAYSDGTVANRKITAIVDNGDGTETLTVASLPAGTITKLSLLRLCVAPDSFELRFHRDIATAGSMVVECAWEFTELLTTP